MQINISKFKLDKTFKKLGDDDEVEVMSDESDDKENVLPIDLT